MESKDLKAHITISGKTTPSEYFPNSVLSIYKNDEGDFCFYIDKLNGREICLTSNIKHFEINDDSKSIIVLFLKAFNSIEIKFQDIEPDYWKSLSDFIKTVAMNKSFPENEIKYYKFRNNNTNDNSNNNNSNNINYNNNNNSNRTNFFSKPQQQINNNSNNSSYFSPHSTILKSKLIPSKHISSNNYNSFIQPPSKADFQTFKDLKNKQGELENDPIEDIPSNENHPINNSDTKKFAGEKRALLTEDTFTSSKKQQVNSNRINQGVYINRRININVDKSNFDGNVKTFKKNEVLTSSRSINKIGGMNSSDSILNSSKIKHRGLNNLGNTCYMNVVLQSLFGLRKLYSYIIELKDTHFKNDINIYNIFLKIWNQVLDVKDINGCDFYDNENLDSLDEDLIFSKSSILDNYDIYNSFSSGYKSIGFGSYNRGVNPDELKECIDSITPIFKGYAQHDSHEFLISLFDILEEQLKLYLTQKLKNERLIKGTSNNNNNDGCDDEGIDSINDNNIDGGKLLNIEKQEKDTVEIILKEICPISNNFKSKIVNKLVCCNCNDISYSEEYFNDISLNIPQNCNKDLNELIDIFLKDEVIERKCSKCKSNKSRLFKFFTSTSSVLILHLKRFHMNYATKSFLKNNTPIKPLENLVLTQYDFEIPNNDSSDSNDNGINNINNNNNSNSSNRRNNNTNNNNKHDNNNTDDNSNSSDDSNDNNSSDYNRTSEIKNKNINNSDYIVNGSSPSSTSTSPSMTPPQNPIESTQDGSLDPKSAKEFYPPTKKSINYSLHSVIQHSGTLYSGHYICCMNSNNCWNQFDDSQVSPLEKEKVLSIKNGYIFFYIKNNNS